MPHVPLLHVLCGVCCESGCEYMRISLFFVVVIAYGRAIETAPRVLRCVCRVCGRVAPHTRVRVGLHVPALYNYPLASCGRARYRY